MEAKHLIYIAGPYSKPEPCTNTNRACRVGDQLVDLGFVPVIPHSTTHLWHCITPRPVAFWYDYDLHLLSRCDALFRFPGDSWGADREIGFAHSWGIPVFTELSELSEWARLNPPKQLPKAA